MKDLDTDKLVAYYDALSEAITNYLYKNGSSVSYDMKKMIIDLNMMDLKRRLDDTIELDNMIKQHRVD